MRTKGATSTVAVTMQQLMDKLKPTAIVYISRRQADELHILGKAERLTKEVIAAGGNQPAAEEITNVPLEEI
jgi:hypothetical protein